MRAGFLALALALVVPLRAQSFFPQRPDDPRAVDFTKEAFGAHADGAGDDADKRTLFIGARGSLYAIRTAAPGVSGIAAP